MMTYTVTSAQLRKLIEHKEALLTERAMIESDAVQQVYDAQIVEIELTLKALGLPLAPEPEQAGEAARIEAEASAFANDPDTTLINLKPTATALRLACECAAAHKVCLATHVADGKRMCDKFVTCAECLARRFTEQAQGSQVEK
jgi:regulator of protease activity HflC (stomatin/prohibitin superfamily)